MAPGMSSSQPERRRSPRVEERVSLAVHDAGTELVGETQNISASGAYCTLDSFIAPMTTLALRLELPHSTRPTPIRCSGVVVRVEPVVSQVNRGRYRIAVLFTDLKAPDRAAIERFVRQRLSAPTHP